MDIEKTFTNKSLTAQLAGPANYAESFAVAVTQMIKGPGVYEEDILVQFHQGFKEARPFSPADYDIIGDFYGEKVVGGFWIEHDENTVDSVGVAIIFDGAIRVRIFQNES